jgi:hypothetical protein
MGRAYIEVEIDPLDYIEEICDELSDNDILDLARERGLLGPHASNGSAERAAVAYKIGDRAEYERLAYEIVCSLTNRIAL